MTTGVPEVRSVASAVPAPGRRRGSWGPWFAGLWLFFLIEPLARAWSERSEPRGVVGIVSTIAFGIVYLALWLRNRADGRRMLERPPAVVGIGFFLALVALGAVMVASIGEPGLTASVYIAVAAVLVFPIRTAAVLVVVVVVLALVLAWGTGWGTEFDLGFSTVAAAAAVLALRAAIQRNLQLVEASKENARLAVDNERSRFARDLHDILGHSLTVITVKAELAGKLVERLSRDALHDVRRAVEGYREITLPGELARARAALAGAEIEADLPGSVDAVPTDLRELFAWTVREGVTNVIRHSGARSCAVRLTATSAEVCDDGPGVRIERFGSGLRGLRERAAASGATMSTRRLDPGHLLQVRR